MYVEVMVCYISVVFLRHSVVICGSVQSQFCCVDVREAARVGMVHFTNWVKLIG